jgi:glutathione S-transferase
MLKLYYARPSAYARPVWLALLEKQLPVELIPVNLGGEQFEPEFLALNPFAHVPVLVDGDFRVIESRAILDYLEAQYPDRSLLPSDPKNLAIVRMVQSVAFSELLPSVIRLIIFDRDTSDWNAASQQVLKVLTFFESLLAEGPFFSGDHLTMAEIVAGTLVPVLPNLGISLRDYPNLKAWSSRLLARPSWQAIALTPDEWSDFKRRIKVLPKIWERRRRETDRSSSQG